MRTILFILLSIYICNALDRDSQLERFRTMAAYKIENIDDNILMLKHNASGQIKYINVKDNLGPILSTEKAMQIFDLVNTPDSVFSDKYTKKDILHVSGTAGYPLIIRDYNNNGLLDFMGTYKPENDLSPQDIAVCELQSDSTFEITKVYEDSVTRMLSATDVDNDGLIEFNLKIESSKFFGNFESRTASAYPGDTLNFKYQMWQITGGMGSETFTDLDKDGITDLIHVGDDSLEPKGTKIYVAEYDESINNFKQRFSYRPEHWYVAGFCYGDFDDDDLTEFVTGSIDGDLYVFENTSDNTYQYTFTDTMSTPNAYLNCATNDIDNNGKMEFFVGGSSYYNGIGGTKVYWFEADGNNHYQKIRTFFLRGTDVLGNSALYNYDVNADGQDDLVFAFEYSIVMLVWNQAGYFELFYYDEPENVYQQFESVNIFDTFSNGNPDLYLSIRDLQNEPRKYSYFYQNNFLTAIEPIEIFKPVNFKLFQNYPNPFNPVTQIQFSIRQRDKTSLIIFDITGKEVIKLLDEQLMKPGEHTLTWDGTNKFGKEVSSGVYLYQLVSTNYTQGKKMILLR